MLAQENDDRIETLFNFFSLYSIFLKHKKKPSKIQINHNTVSDKLLLPININRFKNYKNAFNYINITFRAHKLM